MRLLDRPHTCAPRNIQTKSRMWSAVPSGGGNGVRGGCMRRWLRGWLTWRRWRRVLAVLAVVVGVAGAALASSIVLEKDRWFPEITRTAAQVEILESRVDDLETT